MMIQLAHLDKRYGKNQVFHDLNLALENGIYALLGPNGAGKSTLMNLLTRRIKPDAGNILADGISIEQLGNQYLKTLGYMPQQQPLPGYFSCANFLYYIAALKEMEQRDADEQIQAVLKEVNLWDRRDDKIRSLSGGMKQRLLIAQALLGDPDLIILDEPTAGLDPQERIRIRNLVGSLRRDRIILIATHVVQDIECIADHILFIRKGEISENISPWELHEKMPCEVYEVLRPFGSNPAKELPFKISMMNQTNQGLRIRILAKEKPFPDAIQQDPSLEDMYLAFFGEDGMP